MDTKTIEAELTKYQTELNLHLLQEIDVHIRFLRRVGELKLTGGPDEDGPGDWVEVLILDDGWHAVGTRIVGLLGNGATLWEFNQASALEADERYLYEVANLLRANAFRILRRPVRLVEQALETIRKLP